MGDNQKKDPKSYFLTSSDPQTCPRGKIFAQLYFTLYNLRFDMQLDYVCRKWILDPSGPHRGWLGGAKVSFILRHRGAQLILAYSWARPAILVAGKGRWGCFYFFCFFTFIPVPLSSLSLSFISSTISSIFFLPFSGRRHKMTHKGWCVVKPQLNQNPGHTPWPYPQRSHQNSECVPPVLIHRAIIYESFENLA